MPAAIPRRVAAVYRDEMPTLTTVDHHELDAYEVIPEGATASVVIVQEIFGVNAHIRSVVDRYAARGVRAIAPALFDRIERGIELDYDEAGVAQARGLRGGLEWDTATADVAAAVAHVAPTGPVAVVGYCLGGSIAWLAANELPIAAAVGYYGGQVHLFRDRAPAVPTMLHFGADDGGIPLADVREVEAQHPAVPVHVYDGAGHGFNCDLRPSFHPVAAALAQERTIEFLAANGVA